MLNEKSKTQLLLKVGNKPVVFPILACFVPIRRILGYTKFLPVFVTHRFECKHGAVFHLCHRSFQKVWCWATSISLSVQHPRPQLHTRSIITSMIKICTTGVFHLIYLAFYKKRIICLKNKHCFGLLKSWFRLSIYCIRFHEWFQTMKPGFTTKWCMTPPSGY